MLVWIASFPRSGNTLFRMALTRLYGVKSYSVHGDADLARLGIAEAAGHQDLPEGGIERLRDSDGVHFVKTHDLPPADESPAIYIVRDGRDAMVSYAHYQCDVEQQGEGFEQRLAKLILGDSPRGRWGDHVLAWLDRPSSTAIVTYEDLVADPFPRVRGALSELGIVLPEEDAPANLPSFAQLQADSPAFFRKGSPGQWREEMTPVMEHHFWRWNAAGMSRAGYPVRERPSTREPGPPWYDMESLYTWLLKETQGALEQKQDQLTRRSAEIQAARDSLSWTLTAPLRWLKDKLLRRGRAPKDSDDRPHTHSGPRSG